MTEYIDREKVIELIDYHQEEYFEAETYFELLKEDFMQLPSADVVSKAAYDQVAWERHLAEVQLKNIGKSIGEKMDDVQPVKHGEWLEREQVADIQIDEWQSAKCSMCGLYHTTPFVYYFNNYNFCPSCGAIMEDGK